MMRKYGLPALFVVAFALPATAATKYFVVVDTVNNCSVLEGKASAGLTPIAEKGGYDSKEAAQKGLAEIRKDEKQCKGVADPDANWLQISGAPVLGPALLTRRRPLERHDLAA